MKKEKSLSSIIIKSWQFLLVIGLLITLLGSATIFFPKSAISVIVALVGCVFFITGGFDAWASISFRELGKGWLYYLVGGVANIILGVMFVLNPTIGARVLILYIGIWGIIRGAMLMLFALCTPEMQLAFVGRSVLAILAGLVCFIFPDIISNLIITALGAGCLLVGAFLVFYALILKSRYKREIEKLKQLEESVKAENATEVDYLEE